MKRLVTAITAAAMVLVLSVGATADAKRHPRPTKAPRPTPTLVATPTPLRTISPTPTATLPPTPAPTPTASIIPPQTPSPTPATTPPATGCASSLQVAVDATPAGGTLTLGSCTFHETVTFQRAITIRGPATITGDGVRQQWARVWAADVTIDGLTFVNAAVGGYQCGSLYVSATRFTLSNATLTGGCYADVELWPGSTFAHLVNVNASNGRVVGVIGYQTSSTTIEGGRFHDNVSTDAGNEAGGIKLCESPNVTISGVEADHNVGPGIWLDCYDDDSLVTEVEAHDNTRSGIHVEISARVRVTNSTVYRNGTETGGNAYEARCGIFGSSDQDLSVTGNIAAWNGLGSHTQPSPTDICFVSQNRAPLPHDGNSATGNVLRSSVQSIASWTDWGDSNIPTMGPNELVPDSDPRIAGLR